MAAPTISEIADQSLIVDEALAAGSDVTFTAAPAGSFLPVRVRRVWDTGTTATNLVVVY